MVPASSGEFGEKLTMPDCALYLPASAEPPRGRTMKVVLLTVRRSTLSVRVMPMRLVSAWLVDPFFGEIMLTEGPVRSGPVWCATMALPLPWSLPISTRLPNTVPKSSSRLASPEVAVPAIAPVVKSTLAYLVEKPACA
jgi:hypothetical protein